MKRQWKPYLLALSFVLLAVFALTPTSRVKADGDQPESIVGTWINTVRVNTPPGAPPLVTTELISFNPGGTFTLTDSVFNAHTSQNPFLPPFLTVDISDGYGAWKPQGDPNRFALTFKTLLFAGAKTPTELYGPFFPGQHVGVATIQAVATLQHGEDRDTLEGPFTFQVRNLRGEVVGTGSGTVSATRLRIEPLTP